MSKSLAAPDATMRAHCEDCGWEYERSLDDGDGLDAEQNQEIAARVVRSHAFKCASDGDEEWGTTADVELEMPGGA